jgi:VWA-like protein DUF2201
MYELQTEIEISPSLGRFWHPRPPLIYITDLKGKPGDEPDFPVLWAVTEGRATVPWGRVIELV